MDRIDNSVSRVTVWYHEVPPNDLTNSDPRDRFVYPFLWLMLDSFSYIVLGARV